MVHLKLWEPRNQPIIRCRARPRLSPMTKTSAWIMPAGNPPHDLLISSSCDPQIQLTAWDSPCSTADWDEELWKIKGKWVENSLIVREIFKTLLK